MSVIQFSQGSIFSLFCTEMGKPETLIEFYRRNSLVDMEVLEWIEAIPELAGVKFPKPFETLFPEWYTVEKGG